MMRTSALVALGLLALGGAQAGTIPIDLATQSVTYQTCTGAGCIFPAGSTYTNGNYMNQLFPNVVSTATHPIANSTDNATTGSTTVPFQFATASNGNQLFYQTSASSNVNDQLVVNFGTGTGGIFNIDKIFTMLQANGEASGWQGVTITAQGVDGASNPITDVIKFTAGTDYRGSNSALINGVPLGTIDGTGTAVNPSGNVETQTYGSITNAVTVYNDVYGTQTVGSTNYFTDVQAINLGGAFTNAYLDSVTITSIANSAGGANNSKERLVFYGMTLDQAPEPGTNAMLALGIAMIALFAMRSARSRA